MSKQEILRELNNLVYEHFDMAVANAHQSLFSPDIGLQPRDLVKLVILVENKYNIIFSESELNKDEFDCLEEIAAIVYMHLHN